mgnify:CR=1 FL=1
MVQNSPPRNFLSLLKCGVLNTRQTAPDTSKQAATLKPQLNKAPKDTVRKTAHRGGDPYLAILVWRNTPTKEMDSSSAQRLLERHTKTPLPTTPELLKQSHWSQTVQSREWKRTGPTGPLLQPGGQRPPSIGGRWHGSHEAHNTWKEIMGEGRGYQKMGRKALRGWDSRCKLPANRVDLKAVPDKIQVTEAHSLPQ